MYKLVHKRQITVTIIWIINLSEAILGICLEDKIIAV